MFVAAVSAGMFDHDPAEMQTQGGGRQGGRVRRIPIDEQARAERTRMTAPSSTDGRAEGKSFFQARFLLSLSLLQQLTSGIDLTVANLLF